MAGITILKMNFFQSFWIINASSSVDTDDKIWTLFILIKNLIISYFFSFVMDFFFFQDKTQGPSNQELSNSTLFFWYFLGSCWLAPGLSSGHIALRRKIFCLKKEFLPWRNLLPEKHTQNKSQNKMLQNFGLNYKVDHPWRTLKPGISDPWFIKPKCVCKVCKIIHLFFF